jgi:Flp pilus assembly protein TadG
LRQRDDRGNGVLSASFAVLFFLLTILLVTQVTSHLLARSRLAADADHAARVVASAASVTDRAASIDRQRALLREEYGSSLRVSITVDGDGIVTVDVTAPSPARAVGAVADVLGIDTVHATAEARSEQLR